MLKIAEKNKLFQNINSLYNGKQFTDLSMLVSSQFKNLQVFAGVWFRLAGTSKWHKISLQICNWKHEMH
jgi:hypothetical protein